MNVEQELSRSPWMEIEPPALTPLAEDAETDVLVIGAGIAGLSTAYELAALGRRVMVLDRGRFGRGMTPRTTAHLAFELDDGFQALARAHGDEAARRWYESQSAAVDRIEAICREAAIACDFARVDGYLIPAEPKDGTYLKDECKAARDAGFTDAVWSTAVPGLASAGVRFPRQARMHPTKYLAGLVTALQSRGARLHDLTDVAALDEDANGVTATTGDGRHVRARQVVVATNAPFHLKAPVHTKQAPYRTYAIAAAVQRGAIPDVLVWDTEEPGYHYVRLQPGRREDLLIVGGEDHKSGTADDGDARIGRLEAWMRARYPEAGEVRYAWSGQVYEPADYVGFIGASPEHHQVYLVTGDSGQGMTTGALSGLILRDLLEGRDNPWAALYDPSRLMHRGLGEYVKENVEAAKHWIELVSAREVASVDDILPGEGALVRLHGKPVAAYRDDSGELMLRSAVCTHAGCVVHWNGFERCWDCPCHGSQFSPEGDVLNGPAAKPLAAADAPATEQAARALRAGDNKPRPTA